MSPRRPEGSLISYFSRLITRSGGINLAQGKPGFPPPAELVRHLAEASRDPALHQYAPGNGNFELLALLTKWYREQGFSVDENNLLVVQGATEGLFLALFHLSRTLGNRSGVLAFEPAYESYPRLPAIMGMPFHAFPSGPGGEVDFQALREVVHRDGIRVVLLASPGNPLGKAWTRAELDSLLTILDGVGGWLVFDAVYTGIYFGHPPANPLETGYPRLILVDSFSKRLSVTGWRVGYMNAPLDTMQAIRAIHDFTGLSAPSLAQAALARYLEESGFGAEYTRSCRLTCAANHEFMSRELVKTGFRVAPSQGGYFVWARCPDSRIDGFEMAEALLTAGVGVVPGENFSPRYRDHVRLNIATSTETVQAGARRIRDHLMRA